ncbi:hypothetical protein QN382_00010 [Pseudomonas sp. 10B1]|uniref:hypothetical protein n=1 Tax=unclassified Pseudomonas TaxID=196821 RepID=UPI002AB42874|nr:MULTISPECIES: hypothetical protein [unclassified Pseudomonas]MDY7560775.1 hypothetical protein [Pseudomonas sp. AB6]MEA9997120.1 hypothetical protein [Pseudomonas sp. AA4]MEB0087309.1 hypothetical protein [Pseudomonas sp. RTI1]MEB0128096.1 hypothetical protein [Pseudomonas sp. CCC1.2]MEB0154579.1 hypothetical protein [Pseudomonas sp. CCC4.3]
MLCKTQVIHSLLLCLLIASGAAGAAPAPWYTWQGSTRVVCTQNSPGPGWVKLGGPFKKSDCKA